MRFLNQLLHASSLVVPYTYTGSSEISPYGNLCLKALPLWSHRRSCTQVKDEDDQRVQRVEIAIHKCVTEVGCGGLRTPHKATCGLDQWVSHK